MYLPLAVALAGGGFLAWQVSRLLDHAAWVTHTEAVTADINKLQRLIVDEETGIRGYLLGGEPLFLEPYDRAQPEVPLAIVRLRALVADDAEQVRRLDQLEQRHQAWITLAEAVRGKPAPALARDPELVASLRRRKAEMDAVRAAFDTMLAAEERLHAERRMITGDVRFQSLTLGTAAIVALGLVMAVASRRWIRRIDRAYRAIVDERVASESRERDARLVAEALAAEVMGSARLAEATIRETSAARDMAEARVAELEAERAAVKR